jgi:hypothetical protein
MRIVADAVHAAGSRVLQEVQQGSRSAPGLIISGID